MRYFFAMNIILLFACFQAFGQTTPASQSITSASQATVTSPESETVVPFERAFNFFASAGIGVRGGTFYNVAVSPIDNTIQFEQVSRLTSGISFGLVWNPLPDKGDQKEKLDFIKSEKLRGVVNTGIEAARKHLVVGLLINVFQLSYTPNQNKSNTPIDVGFGIGYRKDNFMALLTFEFSPLNQPRKYFIDSYKDKNAIFKLAGSQEPVKSINADDSSLFLTKLYPAVGIKVAYAFTKAPK